MRILLAICILSLTANAQNLNNSIQIDNNYTSYLNNIFEPSFKKKTTQNYNTHKKIVFGKVNQDNNLLKITKQHSFSISTSHKKDKLLAAILYGIKYCASYEFMADDYERYNASKAFVVKELLKIKIHAIPDTSTMKITKELKINSLETVTQFKHNKLIYLKKPIIVYFYSNHQENINGMNTSSKTIIKHHNKTLYNSIKNDNINTVKHNSIMNKYLFVYRYKNQNKLITGGLMNHLLTNFLGKIKNNIHLNAIHVSNVSDIYTQDIKDMKRIYCRGRLLLKNNTIEI